MSENRDKMMKYKGLSSAEIESKRLQFGSNVMTPPERDPWWKLLLEKFEDPVIRILMIAALIAIAAGIAEGNYTEGIGIIAAILLATTIAFINEYKANKEFDILNKTNDDVPVKTIRDGHYMTVPKRDIVVGDLILTEVGDEIPADGKVIECVTFQIDESQFTGESLPTYKFPSDKIPEEKKNEETTYPKDSALRGTFVKDGHAILEIFAVGDKTELGKIGKVATEESGEETPLNKQLAKLSKIIGVLGFGIAGLTFVALTVHCAFNGSIKMEVNQWVFAILVAISAMTVLIRVWLPIVCDGFELSGKEIKPPEWLENEGVKGWIISASYGLLLFIIVYFAGRFTGYFPSSIQESMPMSAVKQFLEFFMIAVTIIVVAVPEGLAMSVTLSLAYSMRKMTATNNLVRKMHACETIGAATVICSDKTGTLTKNEMMVAENNFSILIGVAKDKSEDETIISEAISANSTANLSRIPGQPCCSLGNPTECALLFWLEDKKIDYVLHRDSFQVKYQWTFTTERKYMGTLGISPRTGKTVLHVKGAPEIILSLCTDVLSATGLEKVEGRKESIERDLKICQAKGMRTLAFAYLDSVPISNEVVDIAHVAEKMTWLGFVAIADPVRPEVPSSVAACKKAGIDVKMVTGDNPETAQEIASQIGLWDTATCLPGQHVTGVAFNAMDDVSARKAALNLKILSRARPMDKLRLVKLLKEEKQVVAVTGDGTNDAPALNYADVGLAMGKTGTSVAKEASDIILLDDSFKSIVNAVMWGRSLYENIQRFILFQLTINVAALFIALLGPFIGIDIPLTVIQMLWINLIMDTFAALALATEPPHAAVLDNPPRKPDSFIVTGSMAKSIFSTAAVFIAILIGLLLWVKGASAAEHPYRLTVFYTVFVMLQFWNLFNARCLGHNHSAFHRIFENKGFILIAASIFIGQILIIQFGGNVFRTVPLTLNQWIVIICATSLVLWIGEIKRIIFRLSSKV